MAFVILGTAEGSHTARYALDSGSQTAAAAATATVTATAAVLQ